ncbi:MAG TPA: efflux RND transporter periplasmic adaptor subunit [Pseudolabrys sp.]
MTPRFAIFALAFGVSVSAVAGYAIWHGPVTSAGVAQVTTATAAERKVLYYRDPGGAPSWSATPKKDAQGRAFLPVYDDAEPTFDPPAPPVTAQSGRKVLFYRNPMGLPDTSPVPKKDSMGMDYIPVYEGEVQEPGSTIKLSVERIQRSGVRTEPAQSLVLAQPVRAVGAVALDERRLTVVSMRSEGYVEDLFVDTTGQTVRKGEPLFRVYSPDIQQALADLLVVSGRGQTGPALGQSSLNGTMRRLRNLGVPEDRIQELRASGVNPRTIDWPSPASGTVISKRIINGQRISAGDELYRIADLSQVWVIADVAEGDLADIKPGTRASVTFRAYMGARVEGVVTFIYPEMRAETRTARVRIEVPNPDGRLKTDMYADVVFHIEGSGIPVATVPSGAIIDSGSRQIVLVAKGEGRFEPRAVKLGRRGDGRVEVVEGLAAGEEVVTSATFLIDAESNLQTALKAFTQPESPK